MKGFFFGLMQIKILVICSFTAMDFLAENKNLNYWLVYCLWEKIKNQLIENNSLNTFLPSVLPRMLLQALSG
jgi:hypothetical protein